MRFLASRRLEAKEEKKGQSTAALRNEMPPKPTRPARPDWRDDGRGRKTRARSCVNVRVNFADSKANTEGSTTATHKRTPRFSLFFRISSSTRALNGKLTTRKLSCKTFFGSIQVRREKFTWKNASRTFSLYEIGYGMRRRKSSPL